MLTQASLAAVQRRGARILPGFLASAAVGAGATLLADRWGAPAMLFALLLGMSLNSLGSHDACRDGVELASRRVLRIGVALLGMRITFAQFADLGWRPMALVVCAVGGTILVSILLARALGFRRTFGLLTGGATAICGASAALALAAALPAHPQKERAALFTVIVVSMLSTAAMIIYPMIAEALDLSPQAAGVFLGATIHDVAQVAGAGYAVSPLVGDTAMVIKLMRIALLLPVIVCAAIAARTAGVAGDAARPPLLPSFAVAFIVLAAVNSAGWISAPVQQLAGEASRWCLVVAIAALGMKTNFRQIAYVGVRPAALMLLETLFLATLVLALLTWGLRGNL